MPQVLVRVSPSGHAVKRVAYALLLSGLALGACSPAVNDKLADGAKIASKDRAWFEHVKDWNDGNFGTIEVKTDFLDTKVSSYQPAFEICQAFVKQYAPDADDKPNLQIYGIQRKTRTKVDGSTKTSEREVIIAQAVNTTSYKCGVNPTYELRDKAQSLGLKVH